MSATPAITIHVPGQLRAYCAGASQLRVSAQTVRAALDDLARSQSALYRNVCDETGTVRRHLNVFVNADNVRDLKGIDTTLAPGDVLTILPTVYCGVGRSDRTLKIVAVDLVQLCNGSTGGFSRL